MTLLKSDSITAVLLVSPEMCFSCEAGVDAILATARLPESGIGVVLSRAPTAAEQRRLVAERIRVHGELASRSISKRFTPPVVLRLDPEGSIRSSSPEAFVDHRTPNRAWQDP
jgi:hypothetical protein